MTPLDDYVWCTDCCETHEVNADTESLHLDDNSFEWPCLSDRVKRLDDLPEAWELSYALARYASNDGWTVDGYEVLPHECRIDPEVHRPIFFG